LGGRKKTRKSKTGVNLKIQPKTESSRETDRGKEKKRRQHEKETEGSVKRDSRKGYLVVITPRPEEKKSKGGWGGGQR